MPASQDRSKAAENPWIASVAIAIAVSASASKSGRSVSANRARFHWAIAG